MNAWLDRAARGQPGERRLPLLERGFARLWSRARLVLGKVTLTAILERAIDTAAARFPVLDSLELEIEATGIRCRPLRARPGGPQQHQLAEAIKFLLVVFLTVLGSLTAEMLTPALHAELAKLASEQRGPGEKKSRKTWEPRSTDPDAA